jgi:hypothetical protein
LLKCQVASQLFDNWEEQVREYLADLQVGIDSLNTDPQAPEDEQEIYELKRQTVTTLVRRVTIDRNRELHVEISLDLLKILTDGTPKRFEGKNKGQIKTSGLRPGWRDDS